ncbi:F-box only protein 48 [Echinops telfairi]|uniref:F-box only protein 48 n=2 Tax=Echinops telfairi TaxID=9371 RepID=A0AC55DEE6_ECHTE|nr:F-box only protein 48 [Echinops telfairi]XP_045150106.1 F-box only protein 48 [Echinops telfairi]
MPRNSRNNSGARVSVINVNCGAAEEKENQKSYIECMPPEIMLHIFGWLDPQSLCTATMVCKRWNDIVKENESLWKQHCEAMKDVCQKEVDADIQNDYSWKATLWRNYRKHQVKRAWLSGRYSNIDSPSGLPGQSMCPMDAETWGEILEVELKRKNYKQPVNLRV